MVKVCVYYFCLPLPAIYPYLCLDQPDHLNKNMSMKTTNNYFLLFINPINSTEYHVYCPEVRQKYSSRNRLKLIAKDRDDIAMEMIYIVYMI